MYSVILFVLLLVLVWVMVYTVWVVYNVSDAFKCCNLYNILKYFCYLSNSCIVLFLIVRQIMTIFEMDVDVPDKSTIFGTKLP